MAIKWFKLEEIDGERKEVEINSYDIEVYETDKDGNPNEIDVDIKYEYIDEGYSFSTTKLSSTFDSNIEIKHEKESSCYRIKGNVPKITDNNQTTSILRLMEKDGNKIVNVKDICINLNIINRAIEWNKTSDIICEITEYSLTNYDIKTHLNNLDGDETFVKVSGAYPNGIKMDSNGIISGTFMKESNEQNTFKITIKVLKNGQEIKDLGEKYIIFEIYPPKLESYPEWITQKGKIGSLIFGETSKLYVKAFDISENYPISYRLKINSKLPSGLSLNEKTGHITGVLKSKQQREWTFIIQAIKIYNNKEYISEREFSIETNSMSELNKIIWEEKDFGEYSVGQIISIQLPRATTRDGKEIKYKLIGGELPRGLSIDKNGILSGQIYYQPYKKYYFDVSAQTSIDINTKTFSLDVKKGIGRNSIKLFLRFNNEYRTQINHIRNELNDRIFDNGSINYDVDTFPKIDIATLTCYDREVLSHMFNFGNPEVVRLDYTKCVQYSQPSYDGKIINKYDVFYKSIDESTLQWESINNGNYDYQTDIDEINSKKGDFEDKEYIDFNNTSYDSNSNAIWSYTEPSDEENEDVLIIKNYGTDPRVQYEVFNFENVRKILSQKIYVYKKEGGYYYYDKGDHRLLGSSKGIDDKTFDPNYNHIEVIDDTNGDLIVENAEVIDDTNGDLVLKDTFEYGENIYNPWCLDRTNENNIKITNIPEDFEMVLPLINDEDVMEDEQGKYIQFLNIENEPLPEWKREDTKSWMPNTEYKENDIIKYNYEYLRCKQDFKTSELYIQDDNLYELLTEQTLNKYLPNKYYPTLDLGFYEIDTNTTNLKSLNKEEKEGKHLCKKDFVFYEVTGEHLYKETYDENETVEEQLYNQYKQEELKEHDSLLGIPFFPMSNVDYGHSKLTKTLTINVEPSDADVVIEPLSNEEVKNSTTLDYGTRVKYGISKPKYISVGDEFTLLMDEEIDIKLKKKVRFILKTRPTDSIITLQTKDNKESFDYLENDVVVGKYIDVKEDDTILYTVERDRYEGVTSTIVAVGEIEKEDYFEQILYVELTPLYTLTIEPTPSDSNVILTCENYKQVGNMITVPVDSYVYYEVNHHEYKTVSGRHRVIRDEILPITLDNNTFTVTFSVHKVNNVIGSESGDFWNYTPHNEPSRILQQIKNNIVVSGDYGDDKTSISYEIGSTGYETAVGTITGVTQNMNIELYIRKICTIEFVIKPDDATSYIYLNNTLVNNLKFDAYYGDIISYEIMCEGFETLVGQETVTDNKIIEINMNDMGYFAMEDDDRMIFITEQTNNPFTKQ